MKYITKARPICQRFFYIFSFFSVWKGAISLTVSFSFPSDPQTQPPAAFCGLCGGELYPEDTAYLIGGVPICEDCFPDFAADYFASQRILALQLLEGDE